MNVLLLGLPSYLSQSNFNFRCAPVQVLGLQPKRQGLETLKHGNKLDCSNISHLQVLWPGADGDFKFLDNNVCESRRLHLSLEAFSPNSEGETCFLKASLLVFTPFSDPTVVGKESSSVRTSTSSSWHSIHPPGLQCLHSLLVLVDLSTVSTAHSPHVPETLFKECTPFLETAVHDTRMDEVKVVCRKRPRFLDIVNFRLECLTSVLQKKSSSNSVPATIFEH